MTRWILHFLRCRNAKAAIVTLHPVLYHQSTTEFLAPYVPEKVRELLIKNKLILRYIVSIHDDIYDCYRPLLKQNALFQADISRKKRDDKNNQRIVSMRSPIQDIVDMRILLDWRDRELAESRRLAACLVLVQPELEFSPAALSYS